MRSGCQVAGYETGFAEGVHCGRDAEEKPERGPDVEGTRRENLAEGRHRLALQQNPHAPAVVSDRRVPESDEGG